MSKFRSRGEDNPAMHLAEKARCTGFSCTFLYKLLFFLYKLSLVLSALVLASLSAKGSESVCKNNHFLKKPSGSHRECSSWLLHFDIFNCNRATKDQVKVGIAMTGC